MKAQNLYQSVCQGSGHLELGEIAASASRLGVSNL